MARKRIVFTAILVIGIVFLILAPILGYTLDKSVLLDKNGITINEDSNNGLTEAYARPFSISKDQKLSIEFSVHYANVSATMKIFGKGFYDQQLALNSSPTGLTGQDFAYSQFVWGQAPSTFTGSANSRTITDNGYWYIEFGGDTSGDYVISIPGKYVVVVYGVNSGPPAVTAVIFNLRIRIDGPGDFLEEIFYYFGIGVIAFLALLISFSYYKKLGRRA
ncbi:MAG: hypothetical protein Lokiarch_24920 [Candidatus Lokiarchaeum sp. GC14_75]|nr:MAG: hypothetical protein Lokiarch_24920 [Candidatus Lokiarchaeum sp. GC14_75]